MNDSDSHFLSEIFWCAVQIRKKKWKSSGLKVHNHHIQDGAICQLFLPVLIFGRHQVPVQICVIIHCITKESKSQRLWYLWVKISTAHWRIVKIFYDRNDYATIPISQCHLYFCSPYFAAGDKSQFVNSRSMMSSFIFCCTNWPIFPKIKTGWTVIVSL